MADRAFLYSTDRLNKVQIGAAVDDMMTRAKNQRWSFERRWYDNNFFDDGFHFRYLSRTQNKIVDLSTLSTIWAPMRAIPKASRQIRGVANLLASRNFIPVVYPEKISPEQYPMQQTIDPQTQQLVMMPNPEYKKALDEAKRVAKLSGHWVTEQLKTMDFQEQLALMIILTAKHGISYIQVWPDAIKESIKTMVFDAFDVYVMGSVNSLEDSPFIIKTRPRLISEIKADEKYDIEQVIQIHPDNRNASSDIKEAYAKTRYGGFGNPDQAATVIEKEAFVREYLSSDNEGRIKLQDNGGDILKKRKKGDPVIRHTFAAGNITLLDEYLNLPGYPIVDLRFEPGPLYQVPLIERFIPQNKSLDLVISRVERFLHTMVTGSWSVKVGEPQEPNNTAAGQVFKYNTTPPVQNPLTSIPPFVFNFMGILESLIEEQGVTTSALGKLPKGVKANAAIESLKESEFANLAIPMERVKGVVKKVTEKLFDYADDYFVSPQTIYYLEKGEPQYFDVIGASAMKKRKDLRIDEDKPLQAVPLNREYRVDIEVQSGLGYTREAQKEAAKQLGDYLLQLSQVGLVSPEVVKIYVQKLFEAYQFGSTNEIMEAMDEYSAMGQQTQDQVDAMKVAFAEVMKDMQEAGVLPTSEQRIQEVKVATAEVMLDTGPKGNGETKQPEKGPSESISFRDLPPEGKIQMAAKVGIELTQEDVAAMEQAEMRKMAIQAKLKERGNNNAATNRE